MANRFGGDFSVAGFVVEEMSSLWNRPKTIGLNGRDSGQSHSNPWHLGDKSCDTSLWDVPTEILIYRTYLPKMKATGDISYLQHPAPQPVPSKVLQCQQKKEAKPGTDFVFSVGASWQKRQNYGPSPSFK